MKKKARKPAKKRTTRSRKATKKRVVRRPGAPFASGTRGAGPRNAGHDLSHVTETIPKARATGTGVSRK